MRLQKKDPYKLRALDPRPRKALSDDQLHKLEALGVVFGIPKTQREWNLHYEKLVAYKKAHYEDDKNRPLEVKIKIDKVNGLQAGTVASVNEDLYQSYCCLLFIRSFQLQRLYSWLHFQKSIRYYKRALDPRPPGTLSDDELQKLQAIGVVFGGLTKPQQEWNLQYEKLVAYRKAHYKFNDRRHLEVDQEIDNVGSIPVSLPCVCVM